MSEQNELVADITKKIIATDDPVSAAITALGAVIAVIEHHKGRAAAKQILSAILKNSR